MHCDASSSILILPATSMAQPLELIPGLCSIGASNARSNTCHRRVQIEDKMQTKKHTHDAKTEEYKNKTATERKRR